MKRSTALLAALLAALALSGAVLAEETLVSRDYLQGIFLSRVDTAVDASLDKTDDAAYSAAEAEWRAILASAEANVGAQRADTFTESTCKRGNLLTGPTGLNVIVLAGDVTAQFSTGAVIDVTEGREITSGTTLTANHRYLVAEDTTARFTVTGKSAVLSYCGLYVLSPASTADYPAMAAALKALGLFRGTGVGYGQGFDLEKAPTRAEALIMLIRLLGEENDALACTAQHPFTDVPDWAQPYVAYGYAKGYSNGIWADAFGTSMPASAEMYVEFLLRALGYSSTAQTDISDSPARACTAGLLTEGEVSALRAETFLRADVVYLSFYALETNTASGTPLADTLSARGVFTQSAYRSARVSVSSARIR